MRRFVVFLIFSVTLSPLAHAINTQSLRYYFPGGRSFSLVESKPKPADTLTLGFGFNYALKPFEFGTTGSARVQGIVDHLYTFDFMGSYSFSDRFSLGLNLPTHITRNVTNLGATTFETPMNLGDILLSALYTVVDPSMNTHNAGFAVTSFVAFPTGRSSDFVGDENVTGGLLLIGDIDINGHYIGANIGARFREKENFLNLQVGHEFLYAVAYHRNFFPSQQLALFGEVGGSTVFEDFFSQANASPLEIRVGATKGFLAEEQLKLSLGSGVGVVNGYGNPDFRAALKLTYDHLLPRTKMVEVVRVVEKPVPVAVEKIERQLKELTIYYPTDGDAVDPFYDQKIAAIAQIMKDNPDAHPLYIVGHTDDVASNRYNQRLSERRAQFAANSIMAHGIERKDIVWVGLGEVHPVVENTTDANRALNRRTLFTFVRPLQLKETPPSGNKNDSYTEVLKKQGQEGQDEDAETTDGTDTTDTMDSEAEVEKKDKQPVAETPVYEDQDIFEDFEE